MMLTLATMLMLAYQTPASATPIQSSKIESLGWLAGCWQQARPAGLTEEQWLKPSGGTMIGVSRTVTNGRTTEYEFLMIRDVGGMLAYVAKPSGQAEGTFPLKTMTGSEVVFEDLKHDFPQRIIYRRNAEGSVTARIEGTTPGGQTRGMDFPFQPCRPLG